MPDRPKIDWTRVHVEWLRGDSLATLGARYGVSKAGISKHASKNGWVRDVADAVARQTSERLAVNAKVNALTPENRERAISAAVDERVAVVAKHRKEWDLIRQMVGLGVKARVSKDATERAGASALFKDARAAAAALSLTQQGERRAYGIRDEDDPDPSSRIYRLTVEVDPYAEPEGDAP